MKGKEYYFTYNCRYSCSSLGGMKKGHINAKSKTEAKEKIKIFLEKIQGTLVYELF